MGDSLFFLDIFLFYCLFREQKKSKMAMGAMFEELRKFLRKRGSRVFFLVRKRGRSSLCDFRVHFVFFWLVLFGRGHIVFVRPIAICFPTPPNFRQPLLLVLFA